MNTVDVGDQLGFLHAVVVVAVDKAVLVIVRRIVIQSRVKSIIWAETRYCRSQV